MPKTLWDLKGAKLLCDHIRQVKGKPSRRDPPLAAFKRFLAVHMAGNVIGTHMLCNHADMALQVFQEFVALYTDLTDLTGMNCMYQLQSYMDSLQIKHKSPSGVA